MFISKKERLKFEFKPYEDCPCESGKKYKFCCHEKSKFFKSDSTSYTAGRLKAIGQLGYKNSDFTTCYGFDRSECSDQGIRAHSLQNNGVLDQIAINNHVSHLKVEFDKQTLNPLLTFNLIGKREASTFYGFCKTHDESYFKCIEDFTYSASSEQHFAFGFRALCLELHKKNRQQKAISSFFKDNPSATKEFELQMHYHNAKLSIRDYRIDHDRFKKIYEMQDYKKLETVSRTFPFKIGFAATTAVGVGVDMKGNKAADIYNYDEKLFIPCLYISVIPRQTDCLVILSRFREDNCYEKVISQAHQANDVEFQNFISFCLAEYSENVYYSPEKVDELSEADVKLLSNKFFNSITPIIQDKINDIFNPNPVNLFDVFKIK